MNSRKMRARINLIYTGICLRNNLFYRPELIDAPPHDGNDGGAPTATVGGCLMRLVREDGWEICPRGLGNGEE